MDKLVNDLINLRRSTFNSGDDNNPYRLVASIITKKGDCFQPSLDGY